MNIHQLIELTGIPERQVRYLVSEGFMPPPSGGRSNADYAAEHIAAIRRYMKLRELGFPPAAIKVLLETRGGAPVAVAPGITLVIDPELIGSGADPAPILKRVERILHDHLTEASHGKSRTRKR